MPRWPVAAAWPAFVAHLNSLLLASFKRSPNFPPNKKTFLQMYLYELQLACILTTLLAQICRRWIIQCRWFFFYTIRNTHTHTHTTFSATGHHIWVKPSRKWQRKAAHNSSWLGLSMELTGCTVITTLTELISAHRQPAGRRPLYCHSDLHTALLTIITLAHNPNTDSRHIYKQGHINPFHSI